MDDISINKQKFLCICDVLLSDKESITFEELKAWSDYIVETPIRALYAEGRKLNLYKDQKFDTMKSAKSVVDSIDTSVIAAYLFQCPKEEGLLGLGQIFEIIGKHSNVLINNPEYGNLIKDYVTLYRSY